MEKRFAGLVIGMMLVVLSFGTAMGAVFTRSAHTMVTSSNVIVSPVGGDDTTLPVMVVNSTNWAIVPGTIVNCIFQEFWVGELDSFGAVQSVNVGEDGYARIPVPSSYEAKFRYATLWVDGDVASVENKMFWYTNDLSMPASIVPVDVTDNMFLGEVREFVYKVLNAWGNTIPNVQVSVVLGNGYITSPQSAVTDSFGEVSFEVTAPSGTIGSMELRVQVEPLSFIQTAMIVSWSGTSPPPADPLPSGTFTASPASISVGGTSTLTLTTANTTAVTLTPYINIVSGSLTAAGGSVVVNPTTTTTYTVTLSGPGGSKSYSATVTVGTIPPPNGEVATITAVNATSYDGSLPVFDLTIGQTFGAVFIAKDSSGNPVSGVSLTSVYPSCVATTDSNGQATITLTGATVAGSDMGQIYVTSDSSKFLDFRVVTGGTTPPPSTGTVATIEAVNNTSSEGSMPVWTVAIGQSTPMVFIAKDSSGQPVVGASLSLVYPSGTYTTDSSGQVSVPSPTSQFAGWDSGRISATSDSTIFLDFKMIYQ